MLGDVGEGFLVVLLCGFVDCSCRRLVVLQDHGSVIERQRVRSSLWYRYIEIPMQRSRRYEGLDKVL